MNTDRFFSLAKNSSKMSDYSSKNIHIGAILVYHNKVLSNGWNSYKTHPIQMRYNRFRELAEDNREFINCSHGLHAEMMCLINTKDIDIDWSKVSLFVYRENNGKKQMCRPCKACMQALKDRGINNIYYTSKNGYNYEKI